MSRLGNHVNIIYIYKNEKRSRDAAAKKNRYKCSRNI